jgi:L-lactate permease
MVSLKLLGVAPPFNPTVSGMFGAFVSGSNVVFSMLPYSKLQALLKKSWHLNKDRILNNTKKW